MGWCRGCDSRFTPTDPLSGGFTLVEVLVSVITLTLVLLTTSSLITNGMSATKMSIWDNVARAAAMGEMERLKALPWAQLSALPASTSITLPDTNSNGIWDPADPALNGIPNMAGTSYIASYDADGDGAADATVKKITISIPVYGGASLRSVWRITTLVSNKGFSE